MNKKLLSFSLMGLLAISLVAAAGFYALFSVSFSVSPAITLEGDLDVTIPGEVIGGEKIKGNPITITNDAPSERTISITDDSNENVSVSYIGTLELTKKDSNWDAVEDEQIEITYTVVGETFEITGVETGYTAIYYQDDESNADDDARLVTIGEFSESVSENLPSDKDWNNGELANYCDNANGYDDYNQCKGAKIWVVPTSDIGEDLTWSNMVNYYYETDLIQYNQEGNIVLSPGASLTITPEYTTSNYLDDTVKITTTVA